MRANLGGGSSTSPGGVLSFVLGTVTLLTAISAILFLTAFLICKAKAIQLHPIFLVFSKGGLGKWISNMLV